MRLPDEHPGVSRRALSLIWLLATAWLVLWLVDQAFYDDDYSRWLNPSRELAWGSVLGALLRPFPPDWGFLDRPGVMAAFKLGDAVFGERVALWFVAKAALGGALVAAVAALVARTSESPSAGVVAALLLGSSDALFGSLLWLSDSEVAAQICVVGAVAAWLAFVADGRRRWLFVLLVVALVGYRFKASAKIVAPLVLVHGLLLERARLRSALPVLGLLVAAAVPWGALGRSPLPPMVDFGGEREWFAWRAFNATSFKTMALGPGPQFWPFSGAPQAIPHGLVFAATPFAAAALLLVAPRWRRPSVLFGIWLVGNVVLLAAYPQIPDHLLGRYLVATWIPIAGLIGLGFAGAPRPVAVLCALLVFGQVANGVRDASVRKRSIACLYAVTDTARAWVEEQPDSIVLFVDQPILAFRAGAQHDRRAVQSGGAWARGAVPQRQGRPVLAVSTGAVPGPRWREVARFGPPRSPIRSMLGPPLGRCEQAVWALR